MRRTAIVLALLGLSLVVPASLEAETAELKTRDLRDNVRMRITGVKRSQARGQNLMVRLAPVEGGDPVEVRFPSHSHTPHETTLMAVVRAVAEWPEGRSDYEWSEVTAEVILSVPPVRGRVFDFTRWFLVSLKIPKATADDDE